MATALRRPAVRSITTAAASPFARTARSARSGAGSARCSCACACKFLVTDELDSGLGLGLGVGVGSSAVASSSKSRLGASERSFSSSAAPGYALAPAVNVAAAPIGGGSTMPPSRPTLHKGKARQMDDAVDADSSDAAHVPLRTTYFPTPLGLPGSAELYLPTEDELLRAVEHLPDVWQLWRRALASRTFSEALHVLSESALYTDAPPGMSPSLPSVLLYLRLFHRIQSPADVRSALCLLERDSSKTSIINNNNNNNNTSTQAGKASRARQASKARLKWDLPHTAYALSVLLERALRDLKAADLIPALLPHVLALTRRTEVRSLSSLRRSSAKLGAFQRRVVRYLRRKGTDQKHQRVHTQLAHERDAVQQLLLRFAKLLTCVQDQRALRAASVLLRHVGSRSPFWQNFAQRDTYAALETTWTGVDGVTFPLSELEWRAPIKSLERWRRRRKGLCRRLRLSLAAVYEPDFVARICRTLLGSTPAELDPRSLNSAVLLPPPLTGRLDGKSSSAYFLPDRQDVDSVLGSSRWLDKNMVQQCLAYLRLMASHLRRTTLGTSDLAVSLMVAIRERDADLAVILIHDLGQVARRDSGDLRENRMENSVRRLPSSPLWATGAGTSVRELLTVPLSLLDTLRNTQTLAAPSSEVGKSGKIELPAYLESGLFHYIDTLARKQMEGRRKGYINTQPFSQAVAKKLFERLIQSHAQTHPTPQAKAKARVPQTRSPKLQARLVTGGTVAKGMETLARDEGVSIEDILACFRLDTYGRDLPIQQRQAAHMPMDVSGNATAYGPALRGFALRGEYGPADVLFRAFVRRATTLSEVYPSLRLHPYILTFRWMAEVQRIQGFARAEVKMEGKRSRGEARRALADILSFIDVEIPDPSASASASASGQGDTHHHQDPPGLDRACVVKPSAKLMTSVVFSLSREWGARRAAVATWLAMERRWPQVARDGGYLQTLVLTTRSLCVNGGRSTSKRSRNLGVDPTMISRKVFRQWLFAQYPELHPDARGSPPAPSWLPEEATTERSSDDTPRPDRPMPSDLPLHGSVDFNAEMFHAYAQLISSMLELRTEGQQRQHNEKSGAAPPSSEPGPYASPIPDPLADVQPTQSEFFLILAWMRALDIQPSNQTLCLFGGHLWRLYKRNHWAWPRGSRFEKLCGSSGGSGNGNGNGSGSGAHVERTQRRYEGMGPLNDWLAEWLEQRWPTGYEIAAYARYIHQMRKVPPPPIWDI